MYIDGLDNSVLCSHQSQNRGGVAQKIERQTRNWSVESFNPIKGSRCFLDVGNLPSLLSTVWFRNGMDCLFIFKRIPVV